MTASRTTGTRFREERHGGAVAGAPERWLDREATAISLLIHLGVRRDGQKVVLAIKNMSGESEAAWRAILDDLTSRGLGRPELVIVDGGKGLETALASLWVDVAVNSCETPRCGFMPRLGAAQFAPL